MDFNHAYSKFKMALKSNQLKTLFEEEIIKKFAFGIEHKICTVKYVSDHSWAKISF